METIRKSLLLILILTGVISNAQNITVKSPDNNISVSIDNDEKLTYTVTYKGRNVINPSQLGFELRDEPVMDGNFTIADQSVKNFDETWIPVVKSKHAEIINNYNELQLSLKEKSGQMRQMEFYVRASNDGAAFRYKLSRHSAYLMIRKHGSLIIKVMPHQMKLSFLSTL
jgi:alpha-glucosidase